eukprot:3209460-Prymnesium_polylepis.2
MLPTPHLLADMAPRHRPPCPPCLLHAMPQDHLLEDAHSGVDCAPGAASSSPKVGGKARAARTIDLVLLVSILHRELRALGETSAVGELQAKHGAEDRSVTHIKHERRAEAIFARRYDGRRHPQRAQQLATRRCEECQHDELQLAQSKRRKDNGRAAAQALRVVRQQTDAARLRVGPGCREGCGLAAPKDTTHDGGAALEETPRPREVAEGELVVSGRCKG